MAAACQNWSWYGRFWALWIHRELVRPKKTASGKTIAYSTVFGPFSEAASKMLRHIVNRNVPLTRLPDVETLEELYELVLDDSPISTRQRTCATLLRFHSYVSEAVGIEALDSSRYWRYWRPDRRERGGVRTELPSTQLMDQIEQILDSHAGHDSDQRVLENFDRRATRQALILYQLARHSGARITELLGLQLRDLVMAGNGTALIIRNNRLRRLKTAAARRLIDLGGQIGPEARSKLGAHVNAERLMLSTGSRDAAWLFSDADGRPVGEHSIRRVIDQVSKQLADQPVR